MLEECEISPAETAKWARYDAKLKQLANQLEPAGGQEQPPKEWPLEPAWDAPTDEDVKMGPDIAEQWDHHEDTNTNTEALHRNIAELKLAASQIASAHQEQTQRSEAIEAFVAAQEDQSAWNNWQTEGEKGGKGNKSRDAASSPYGKGSGSKDDADNAMG